MLSVEKCKELLRDGNVADEEVAEIRDVLYQLARVLVSQSVTSGAEAMKPGQSTDNSKTDQ